MSVHTMLTTTSSTEVGEWIAEFKIREKEQDDAMKKAQQGSPSVMGG